MPLELLLVLGLLHVSLARPFGLKLRDENELSLQRLHLGLASSSTSGLNGCVTHKSEPKRFLLRNFCQSEFRCTLTFALLFRAAAWVSPAHQLQALDLTELAEVIFEVIFINPMR